MINPAFHSVFEPSISGSTRTVLVLHGTGGNEQSLIPLATAIAPTAALLSVRGQVIENGMPRFFRRFAEGVFDIPDLLTRTDDLAHFLSEASTQYGFDSNQVFAIGYSNGANIASSLLFRRPEALAGAILLRGMTPFEPKSKPSLAGKPVLLLSGRQDPIVPVEDATHLTELLLSLGANATHLWSDFGHGLMDSEIEEARLWFTTV